MKRALTVSAVIGLLVALAPPLLQAADAQPCPSSQPPGRPPGQPVGGDSGRPEGYGPGECQLLLSQSTGSAGSSFTVSGSGFSPGSNVTVTFESDPVVLAVVTADSTGSFTAGVAVPDGAEPGNHTVRASGVGADGEPHAQAAAFKVVGQSEAGAGGSQEPSSTGGSASPAATPADAGPSDASSGGDEDAAPPTESSDDGDDDVVAAAPANTTGTSGGASSTLAGVGLGLAAVTVISLLVGLRRRRHAAA